MRALGAQQIFNDLTVEVAVQQFAARCAGVVFDAAHLIVCVITQSLESHLLSLSQEVIWVPGRDILDRGNDFTEFLEENIDLFLIRKYSFQIFFEFFKGMTVYDIKIWSDKLEVVSSEIDLFLDAKIF